MNHSNWLNCTPVAFRGDEKSFFSRDSGLCCRALQSAGAEAKVVMPEPAWDDDTPDVLRAPYKRLSDPAFWREQHVEAVIFYSWTDPKYTPIARAIHSAGLKLFINIDTHGLFSLMAAPQAYIRLIWAIERQQRGFVLGSLVTLRRLGWQCVKWPNHFSRLRHMDCADAIGVPSPVGAERVRQFARFFRREDLAQKIHFVPHPIDQTLRHTGLAKQEKVIAVGRWDDPVKRPELLIDVAMRVLLQHPTVQLVIVGKQATQCAAEIAKGAPAARGRVTGYDRLEHDQLCEMMNSAQISLCTSRYESFHMASAEALLCGCSIVAPQSPYLPSLPYFVDEGRSGRLSDDTPESLARAVLEELNAWQVGERDAATMAQTWRERIVAPVVVEQIDNLLARSYNGSPSTDPHP